MSVYEKESRKIRTMVLTALLMALILVLTFATKIPIPASQGYIHLGDCMIFMAVIVLGRKYGTIAAAVGSALADIMGGYGDIAGAVFGALLAGIVENMIVMLNINTNYSKAVQGVIIVLAVAFNVYNNRKSAGLIAPRKKRAAAAPKKEA